jgi:hypothetical protein
MSMSKQTSSAVSKRVSPGENVLPLIAFAIVLTLIFVFLVLTSGFKVSRPPSMTKATLTSLSIMMSEYLKTHPDPGANWLFALKTDPQISSRIRNLPQDNGKITDSYGNTIEYVPAHTSLGSYSPGYFRSAGPDGILGNSDDIISSAIAP